VVVPLRTHGGQRHYTEQNLLVPEEIKKCQESGLSLPEIGERIHRGWEKKEGPSNKIELLANRVAEVVKTEVYNFFKRIRDKTPCFGNRSRWIPWLGALRTPAEGRISGYGLDKLTYGQHSLFPGFWGCSRGTKC
jgi:DNA-binding transcriptional MerR regulator